MAFSSQRIEYSCNYTKEHYKKLKTTLTKADYDFIKKEAELKGFSNRAFTLSAVDLLLAGELENELKIRMEEVDGKRGSKSIFKI